MFLTRSLSKRPSSTNLPPLCPEKFLVAQLHSGIFIFSKCSTLNVWQCSEYVSVSITAQLFLQWPYVMYCIRHIQNSGIFSTLFFLVYAGVFNHIQRYWGIFTPIEILLRLTEAYSAYSAPRNFDIFWDLAYLELDTYL